MEVKGNTGKSLPLLLLLASLQPRQPSPSAVVQATARPFCIIYTMHVVKHDINYNLHYRVFQKKMLTVCHVGLLHFEPFVLGSRCLHQNAPQRLLLTDRQKYTVLRKELPFTFSFISPWKMLRFILNGMFARN